MLSPMSGEKKDDATKSGLPLGAIARLGGFSVKRGNRGG